MKRNAIKRLMEWKNNQDRKPVWIKGAKGVGKTYLMLDFAKSFYEGSIYINFERDINMRSLFEKEAYSFTDDRNLIELICDYYQISTEMSHQLIFMLDEITECPEAVTLLSDFADRNTGYSIVVTGSNSDKIPVDESKYEYIELYPLNFDEFIIATGSEWYIDIINAHFNNHRKIPDIVHEDLLNSFEDYLVVGGMPAAVNDYIANETTYNICEVHDNIRAMQLANLTKNINDTDALRIKQIMDVMPAQLYKDNRKFQYRLIRKGVTYNLFSTALKRITNNKYALECNKYIAGAGEDEEAFKLYFSDIGMLHSEYKNLYDLTDVNEEMKIKKIMLENYAIQQLRANGIQTMFWESGTLAKLDFVLKSKDGILPLEIIDKEGKRSKSLGVYKSGNETPYSYKMSNKNFSFANNIFNIPFYSVYCIR